MISSKQILKLFEEYFTLGSINGHAVTVYKNPTVSDFLDMRNETQKVYSSYSNPPYKITDVRFIADAKNKTLYVVDATLAEHSTLRRLTKVPTQGDIPYLLEGMAYLRDNKLIINDNNSYSMFPYTRYKDKFFEYDWSFADKYINNFTSVFTTSEFLGHFNK